MKFLGDELVLREDQTIERRKDQTLQAIFGQCMGLSMTRLQFSGMEFTQDLVRQLVVEKSSES